MIPQRLPTWQSLTWQQQLSDCVRRIDELCDLLQLDEADFRQSHLPDAHPTAKRFPLRVPRAFISRMQIGNLFDPLLLQVLPSINETITAPGFVDDPLGESDATPVPGIIHKYHGRVLLMLTGACAVHCRYCFRREFPYEAHRQSQAQWSETLRYLQNDTNVNEVILSGGDPLSLGDDYLSSLVQELSEIEHLETLRIHTRLPIVIPDRISDSCVAWMKSTRLKVVMVIHCNHHQELDDTIAMAIQRLQRSEITILNQSVLLKGVNNSVDAMAALSKNLFKIGVLPYYLHMLDKVRGAQHFWIESQEAESLHRQLKHQLPGYLVPKLVREDSGAKAKTVIG